MLTDNVNRAAAETRAAVNKGGGKMADSGSVVFMFERRGVVVVKASEEEEDKVLEIATEVGADDVAPREDGEEGFVVTTSVPDFVACRRALVDAGYDVDTNHTAGVGATEGGNRGFIFWGGKGGGLGVVASCSFNFTVHRLQITRCLIFALLKGLPGGTYTCFLHPRRELHRTRSWWRDETKQTRI